MQEDIKFTKAKTMNKITQTILWTAGLALLTTTAHSAEFDVSGIETITTSGYNTAVKILGLVLTPVLAISGFKFFKRQIEWDTLKNILIGCILILLAPKIAEFIINAVK